MSDSRQIDPAGGRRGGGLRRRGSWPLERRLMAPLGLLVVAVTVALSVYLVRDISSRMDRETDARLDSVARALAESRLPLERSLLGRLREVTDVHVLVIGRGDEPLATTLDERRARALRDHVGTGHLGGYMHLDGERHRFASREAPRIAGVDAPLLVVAASTSATDRLKRDVAWTISLGMTAALILMLVIAHLVVRAATRPLAALADAARTVGGGALDTAVPGGGGREIDALATEFNAMTRELDRSRRRLVTAEKLAVAGRLAASVAHEVRNPLSSMRMNIQLLLRSAPGKGRVAGRLRELLDEIDGLDVSLRNLLDLSANDARPREPGDLSEVVRSVLSLTAARLEHLKIDVIADLACDVPRVPMDADRIRQAVLNVVLNAAHAMPTGGTMRVTTRPGGRGVELVVEDDGVGLDPSISDRAFEPFVSSSTRGAGLGLYVVRQVVDRHGGLARLEPARDRGTRCVITLPLLAPGQSAGAAARARRIA